MTFDMDGHSSTISLEDARAMIEIPTRAVRCTDVKTFRRPKVSTPYAFVSLAGQAYSLCPRLSTLSGLSSRTSPLRYIRKKRLFASFFESSWRGRRVRGKGR